MSASPLVELVDVSLCRWGQFARPGFVAAVAAYALVLLGPNGAGKTTLIKILGGLMWPNAGEKCYAGCSTREPAQPAT